MSQQTRIEHDTMGDIDVRQDRLWGAQTERSLHHFHFPGEEMPVEVVRAQVLVKKAAAAVNMIGAKVGDTVVWRRPAGETEVYIVGIRYP